MRATFLKPTLGLCLLLLMTSAQAAIPGMNSAGLFDSILERFARTSATWGTKMVDYGTWLFWSLTLLSMVWTYGLMALKKADIQEFLAETVRFFTVTGFFFWLLRNGPAIAMSIIDTLRAIAANATGLGNNLSPSGIVDIGFDIAAKVIDRSSIWSPASSTVGLLIAAIILIILAIVGVNMLIMLISAWLLAYGGVFLLGFGGGRWTQDIAIQYYKTVLGIGLQTLTMIIVVGIGKSFIDQYYAALGNEMGLKEVFVMLVVSVILLLLVDKLPPMIAGIVGGSSGAGGGMGGFGAGAALGAAGMAAGMASGAAASALGGASSLAGGASAIAAAFQAAQQGMAGNAGSGSSGGSSGGLAAAMGNAGRFAADMGAHLAQGAVSAMTDKMDAMKDAAAERISNTVGGKIATSIKTAEAGGGGSQPEGATQAASNDSFDGDSLGAGKTDEVADFVNKPATQETPLP